MNWDRAEYLLPLGGVRIEDTVHVTESGPEVLTADIPKEIAEVESLREEAGE